MGHKSALQDLNQSEGFAEGRERWSWGQWLQPEPSPSYTSTPNDGVNVSLANKAAGEETEPWEQTPAVTAHKTVNT